jgi:hypothetical protein
MEDHRDRSDLNRCGSLILRIIDSAQQLGHEPKFSKSSQFG